MTKKMTEGKTGLVQLSMILLMCCTDDKSTDTSDRPTVEDVGSDADADSGSGSASDDSGADPDDSTPVEAEPVGRDVVTYVGGLGTVLSAGLQLSDGSFLLGGSSPDLAWLPEETEVVELSLPAVDSAASGLAILLHLSPGLETIEAAWHFPEGTVRDIRRIRTTNVPGAPTGTLFVSGSRDDTAGDDGYYIARLDGNVVDVPLTGASWSYDVDAPPRSAGGGGGESDFETRQPWDVDAEGRVTFVRGAEYDFDWASIHRLDADGHRALVPEWPVHWIEGGGEHRGPTSSYAGDGTLAYSGIVMKAGRAGSLRSQSQEEFDRVGEDANGNPGRRGTYPDDYFFSGPCVTGGDCPGGPGWTGYQVSSKPTQRVGAIEVDRRTGALYLGYSTQSVLPNGNPDFEPAVVAFDVDGTLLWWDRLYEETTANSSPDQYVDGLAIDYLNDRLLVMARCHGNNTINFWRGHELAENPEGSGFQNQFTGTNGNIHISWLGRYDLSSGRIERSSYIAEYNNTTGGLGSPLSDPLLDGWPNPNGGWPDVNTTRCEHGSLRPAVSTDGSIWVACTGRRTITTSDAHQKMLHFDEGNSAWNQFVRGYSEDLDTLVYSTLVTGVWDPETQQGANNTRLYDVIPVVGGVLALGIHEEADGGGAEGNPVPTAGLPAWGRAEPGGPTGLLVHLNRAP